jgi:hypothetical protein
LRSKGPISGPHNCLLSTVPLLYTSMNNDEYNHIEYIRGQPYRYDPDFDAYYRVQESEGPVSKYAWIVMCILLAIVCYCIETRPLIV